MFPHFDIKLQKFEKSGQASHEVPTEILQRQGRPAAIDMRIEENDYHEIKEKGRDRIKMISRPGKEYSLPPIFKKGK